MVMTPRQRTNPNGPVRSTMVPGAVMSVTYMGPPTRSRTHRWAGSRAAIVGASPISPRPGGVRIRNDRQGENNSQSKQHCVRIRILLKKGSGRAASWPTVLPGYPRHRSFAQLMSEFLYGMNLPIGKKRHARTGELNQLV